MSIIDDLNDKNQVGCTSYLSEDYNGPLQWEVEKARRNRTNFQTTGWVCTNVTKLAKRYEIMLEQLLTMNSLPKLGHFGTFSGKNRKFQILYPGPKT